VELSCNCFTAEGQNVVSAIVQTDTPVLVFTFLICYLLCSLVLI